MENQKQNISFGEKQIINLLRKQNAILADIFQELKKKNKDANLESTVKMNTELEASIPKLLPNERNLTVCHVVSDGFKYTFNDGCLVMRSTATPADIYMYRNADKGE